MSIGKKSLIEKGQLTLILEVAKKITISGKCIDISNHRNRIRELFSMTAEKGFDIPEKSVKQVCKGKGN